MPRILFLGLLFFTLTACSLFRPLLMPENTLLLLPPAEGPKAGLMKQKVTVIQDKQPQSFIALSRFIASDFRVAVITPTGQTLLKMNYDGNHFQATNLTDMTLPLEEVMSVMQFALWPEKTVHKYYNERLNWQVELTPNYRRLYKGNTLILDVRMSDDNVDIHHKQILRGKFDAQIFDI